MTYNSNMFEAGRGSIYNAPPKSKPKSSSNANKQAAGSMGSVGIGGIGGKPTTSSASKIQSDFMKEFRKDDNKKGLGASTKVKPTPQKSFLESLYDRVRGSILFAGGDPDRKKRPDPNPGALYTASPFIIPAATAVTASVLGPGVDYTDPTEVPRGTPSIYTPDTRDFGKNIGTMPAADKPASAKIDISDLLNLKEKVVFRDAPGLMDPPSMAKPAAPATAMSAAMAEGINKTLQSVLSADPDVPYVIQAGDTLSEIAVKTGTTVEDLVKENKIEDKERIYTGNELKIPSAKATKTKEDIVSSLIGGMNIPKVGDSFEGEGIETALLGSGVPTSILNKLFNKPKEGVEVAYTDDDMGIPIGPVPEYTFMTPGSKFTEALKAKEADNYDTIFGNAEVRNTPFRGKKVSDMTLDQVIEFTKLNGPFHKYNQKKGYNTTAVGKYQIVGKTLRDLNSEDRQVLQNLGITGNTKFDQKAQDDIAAYLAVHRIKDRATKGDGNIATRGSARKEMRNEWEGFKKVSDEELDEIIDEVAADVGVEIVDTTVSKSPRPKTRPPGLMTSPRPRIRPENL